MTPPTNEEIEAMLPDSIENIPHVFVINTPTMDDFIIGYPQNSKTNGSFLVNDLICRITNTIEYFIDDIFFKLSKIKSFFKARKNKRLQFNNEKNFTKHKIQSVLKYNMKDFNDIKQNSYLAINEFNEFIRSKHNIAHTRHFNN